jgi:hypothetical protein
MMSCQIYQSIQNSIEFRTIEYDIGGETCDIGRKSEIVCRHLHHSRDDIKERVK